MSPRTALARTLTLACFAALVLILTVEMFGVVRLELRTRAVLWAMWIAPLLLFLPGLLRAAWRSYLWLCFVLCMYFTVIVTELFTPTRNLADWMELGLVVVLFVTAMMFSRWRQRELATENHGSQADG